MTPDQVREWVIVVGGAIAFGVGLWQFAQAQKWKRMEWLAIEVERFRSDPFIANALMILDWKERRLPMLLEAPEDGSGNVLEYTEDMLDTALRCISRPQTRDYTDEELVIRDCMDRLLDRLELFEAFIKNGLVSAEELYPFVGYWLDILANPDNRRKSSEARVWIATYAIDYHFDGVPRLLGRFRDKWPGFRADLWGT